MDIKTVIANLDNTIAGKKYFLEYLEPRSNGLTQGSAMANTAVCEFLKINIAELERIRDDLLTVQCEF